MFSDITLFIPTHNRHRYLKRILEYYASSGIKILVADSSANSYKEKYPEGQVKYLHLPGLALPQKMAKALAEIITPFVVMCADDDFIIINGIESCLQFLRKNIDYAAAHGNCILYDKITAIQGRPQFTAMYTQQLSFSINDENFLDRIRRFLDPYRTIFCAVHRTVDLQRAYRENIPVNNLFLNEYLSGIIPLSAGKYIELPVFYQVREYADDSGDKTTDNLDTIVFNKKYEAEYIAWLNYIADAIADITNADKSQIGIEIKKIIKKFAISLQEEKTIVKPISAKKKIGKFVGQIPLIGHFIIQRNRKQERKAALAMIIRTDADKKNLLEIESLIKKYALAIKQ